MSDKLSIQNTAAFSCLVVIPAYNAAQYLPTLIPRLREFVCDENLLIVNDGSTDDTVSVLKELAVTHLSFLTNRGKGAALNAGFSYAHQHGYRSVLTLDADLQHLPEEIPRFFALDNGQRIVIGMRQFRGHDMPFLRWLTNNLTSLIVSIFSSQRVCDSQSGFRLLPVSFLRHVRLRSRKYDFESEMLFKAGVLQFEIREVSISTVYEGSHSYINPLLDTGRFIRQIFRRVWV